MSGERIPPKRPLGFGSSASRFFESKKDEIPGPGAYESKQLGKGSSHSFGKAKRFANEGELIDKHFRGDIDFESSDVAPKNLPEIKENETTSVHTKSDSIQPLSGGLADKIVDKLDDFKVH